MTRRRASSAALMSRKREASSSDHACTLNGGFHFHVEPILVG